VSTRHAGLLAALAALWGASYLLIKYALDSFEPAFVVFLRTALASLVLFAVLAIQGAPARAAIADVRARPRKALLLGALAITAPFLLITFGELEVPSGLTAVLIAPASLFVALFAPFLDPSEGIHRRQALGMVLGLVGVALLVGVESVSSLGEFLGAIAMLTAAACYALSSFVVKNEYRQLPPIAVSFISVTAGCLLTIPVAAATAPTEAPELRSVLAVLVLGFGGTALAFVIFYKLIAEIGAARASLVSYLAPGVALAYGALLLDEKITVPALAGLALILGGVFLASRAGRPAPEPVEGICPEEAEAAAVPVRR
jgi:drug/metabolite transporter (DMT)-like permease